MNNVLSNIEIQSLWNKINRLPRTKHIHKVEQCRGDTIRSHMFTLSVKNLIFNFLKAIVGDIIEMIKTIHPRKATGPDGISIKVIVIDSHLTYILNKTQIIHSLKMLKLLSHKNDRDKIQNYRPLSSSYGFSKIYGRYLLKSMSGFIEKICSNFIAAYRKPHRLYHVSLRLIENWKNN